VSTKRSLGGTDEGKARKAARVQDGVRTKKEAEPKQNRSVKNPCEAAGGPAPTRTAAPQTDPPPSETDLLQTVADRLLNAANAGILDCCRASMAALELTSSRLAREPGSRARLVIRARAIRNLLDSGDYHGLIQWLGD
jgi:hypothetical protein